MMRRERFYAALALALMAALWGLCWLLEPHTEAPQVRALPLGSEDGEGSSVLAVGEAAQGGVAFRNTGHSGCRLRVRLCVAQVDGKPVLEAGDETEAGFVPAGEGQPEGEEYWTARGEYLYYVNQRTGDLLLPGRDTPAVYTSVRLNGSLGPEELETLELLGAEQQLFLLVEPESA